MGADARLDSRRVYSGRVISLDVDQVRFPDGSRGELEIIRHPGAAAVVPFLTPPEGEDPQVLLIRQYRYAADGFVYEIPAGCLDLGEDPIDCARRELLEETGCSAQRVQPLVSILTTPGFTDEKIHLFLASGLSTGASRREADEFIEIEAHRMSDVLGMVERGDIIDAKSMIALMYVARFVLRN